jgi:hypothetical protein
LQVLPYFYVPYDEDLPGEAVAASHWLRRLARGLDAALAMQATVRRVQYRLLSYYVKRSVYDHCASLCRGSTARPYTMNPDPEVLAYPHECRMHVW